MTARILYVGHWPDVARATVEPDVAACAWLLPPWVWELQVRYDATETAELGTATTYEAYGQLRVDIGVCYLAESPEERLRTMRHEIIHALVHPLVRVAQHAGEAAGADNPALGDVLRELRRVEMERVTSAIEYVVSERLAGPPAEANR